jgi:hypothetical protein
MDLYGANQIGHETVAASLSRSPQACQRRGHLALTCLLTLSAVKTQPA